MLVTKNAYHVLGLSSDNDEKKINKRYKEILNLLSIDEVPTYDFDVSFVDYKKLRKESYVKEALHRLNNQKKSLYEFFFWFNIVDNEDEKCLSLYIEGEYRKAINRWSTLYEENKKLHYIKNAVIANLLLYENLNQFGDLDFSEDPIFITKGLYRIVNSDKFWKEFETMYNAHNTIPLSENLLKEFRKELPQFLTEAFFDIGEEVGTNRLYRIFSKKFELVAQELDDNKNVTTPIKKIEECLENIKKVDKKGDLEPVFENVEKIKKYIEKLDKLGLSENAKVIKLKDDVAERVLSLGISIYNDHNRSKDSQKLMKESLNIAVSPTLIARINENLKTMDSNIELEKKYDGWAPGMCWYCKERPSVEEESHPIHKVIERKYGKVRYQTYTLKVPICGVCKKRLLRQSWTAFFIAFALALGVGIWSGLDSESRFTGIILGLLVGWFGFALISWFIGLITGDNYNDYPIWKELKKEGRASGEKPSNTR